MNSSLIILSIPLQRLVKTHLSRNFIDALKNNGDILVVSPFSDNLNFINDFRNDIKYFVKYQNTSYFNPLKNFLLLVIKVLRMNGYWRANHDFMSYYILNQYTKFGKNGNDLRVNFISRIGIFFLGIIGAKWKNSWKLFSSVMPINNLFKKQIFKHCSEYRNVILIQASAWCNQDIELARIATKNRWNSIFVPYTTDQLLCNGWLFAQYDWICVQGPLEEGYAINFHKYDEYRVVRMGSINFRILDSFVSRMKIHKLNYNKIIYAGSISRYFPLSSEIQGVEIILDAIKLGELQNCKVVYRSFCENGEAIERLKNKYHSSGLLEIEVVSELFAGLDRYDGIIKESQYIEYVQKLKEATLLVTVGCTSLTLDAAFLALPSVIYWADKTGVISKRNTNHLFSKDGRLRDLYIDVPTVHTEKELISMINANIKNPSSGIRSCDSVLKEWDFIDTDSFHVLSELIAKLNKTKNA